MRRSNWVNATVAILSLTSACSNTGPSATASPSVNSTIASLTCEIPFVASDQRIYYTGDGAAGFLKLPEGTFRSDANSAITHDESGSNYTSELPVLSGSPWHRDRSWDGRANRWLPVPSHQVSFDGATYVYQLGPEVHLVTVATGADRLIYRQPSGFPPANYSSPHLLAFQGDAVDVSVDNFYKTPGGGSSQVPVDQAGVWRIDPGGAAPSRLLTDSLDGILGAGGVIWSVEHDRTSPRKDTLVRYDLASARKDSWFTDADSGMELLGLDREGRPIVWTYDNKGHIKIWLVSGPEAAKDFYSETYAQNVSIYAGKNSEFGHLTADSHGVWFGSTNGLFLYDATGMRKVADKPGIPLGQCR